MNLPAHRSQVLDFMKEFVQVPAVVVGNSMGGLTSLMVSLALKGQGSVRSGFFLTPTFARLLFQR